MIIEPGRIGPVHAGMKMQQVIDELGEPEEKKDSVSILVYRNLGFTVLRGNKEGHVGSVICVDTGAAPAVKRFAGHTKEGIGIGSSRADVIKAYGEPTTMESRGNSGTEVLRYKQLGLDFKVRDEKVYLIGVFFKIAP